MCWVMLKSTHSLGPEFLASNSFSLVKAFKIRLLCCGQVPATEIPERIKNGTAQALRSTVNKWDFMKRRGFCAAKDTVFGQSGSH